MPIKPATERRLREAGEAFEEARLAREDAIVDAWRKGGGMREIGDIVGMSHVGVAKMLERLGFRKRWTSVVDANREYEERERRARGD